MLILSISVLTIVFFLFIIKFSYVDEFKLCQVRIEISTRKFAKKSNNKRIIFLVFIQIAKRIKKYFEKKEKQIN